MTFPTRKNPIRLLQTRHLCLKDKGSTSRTLTLVAETEYSIRQVHPQSLAKQGEKSCDWLIEIISGGKQPPGIVEQVYVELKTKNGLEKAVLQLQATIERFDPKLTAYRKRSYAVGVFTKPAQLRVRLEDKRFQKKYRSRFEIVRGHSPVPLCSHSKGV